ncbi:MAG: PEP-CTERM sorting domain-containing protein, partial [Verrucomicrobiota bacterium]|nr:PEP-CTERM sorting domain-containing protein [Verrucomicrobiota bacterium]
FAGGGGGGMFQQNLNGSLGADAISIGHDTGGGQQHASGAGGRDYHISVTVSAIPEPTVFPLLALSGLGLLLRRRRS